MLLELVNKFPVLYRIHNVPCFSHKHPPIFPFLKQINTVHVPITTALRYVLILSSHLGLGLPNCLFLSGFYVKNLHSFLHTPIRATCPAHLILLALITRTIFGEQYTSLSSLLCSFLPFYIPSSLLEPDIFISTLSSSTLSLCPSLNVRDQVPHPYKTTDMSTILCFYLYIPRQQTPDQMVVGIP